MVRAFDFVPSWWAKTRSNMVITTVVWVYNDYMCNLNFINILKFIEFENIIYSSLLALCMLTLKDLT